MSKIKCEINEDSTLIKYNALQDGEIFIRKGEPCIKLRGEYYKEHAIRLKDGSFVIIESDELVTYVKSAELKLTI